MRTKKKTDRPSEDLTENRFEEQPEQDMVDETDDEDLQPDFDAQSTSSIPASLGAELKLPISHSMLQKLGETAEEEGISVLQLCSEFLSEGLTKRAWDINVRTSGRNQQQPNNQGQRDNRNNNRNHFNNNNNSGGNYNRNSNSNNNQQRQNRHQRQHANNMNIMQDKAAFLEYVRKQEQKRR